MSTMTESALKSGTIFGDIINNEYIYMPASEIGMDIPICIFETANDRTDLTFTDAVKKIHKLSLKPVTHPQLGKSSC